MLDLVSMLREELTTRGELRLQIKAIPKSSRNEIVGFQADGSLKVKITAAPERGKANEAICHLLAKELDVPRRAVIILRGEASATKQLVVKAQP